MGLAQQFFLHQSYKLLLHSSHILVTHLFQPRPYIPLEHYTFRKFVPVYGKFPKLLFISRNLFFQFFDQFCTTLLFLFINLLILQLRNVQLKQRFFFFLLLHLFITIEKLILLELLWFLDLLLSHVLRSLHNNLLNLLGPQLYFFFNHSLHSFLFGLLSCHLLFRQWRILLEHDFHIFLLLFLDLAFSFFSQVLGNPPLNFLFIKVHFFFESAYFGLIAFAFSLLLLSQLSLLNYYPIRTFSRQRLSQCSSFCWKLRSSSYWNFFLFFYRYFSLGCYFLSYSLIFSMATFLTSICIRKYLRLSALRSLRFSSYILDHLLHDKAQWTRIIQPNSCLALTY